MLQLDASVFIVPGEKVKNREDRIVGLNRVTISVVEQVRGYHPEYVFTYRGNPIQTTNNSGWKTARKKLGLSQVRAHDLKRTFGRRLRVADAPLGNRKRPELTLRSFNWLGFRVMTGYPGEQREWQSQ